jgi:hypothetical protein
MSYVQYEKYRKTLICTICKEKAYRKNLCRACYKRDQQTKYHCLFKSCTSPVFAATLCQKHFRSWQTHCLYCNRMVHCRHLCRSHYRKALKLDEFPQVPKCDREDCDKNTYLNHLCLEHYKDQFRTCIIVECNNHSHRRGLCCKHYFREIRNKD